MTVDELLSRISSREITEWQAYCSIEPFGEERADMRSALIASVMANAWRGKNQKAFGISDFMLNFAPPKPQSEETIKAILKGMCK